MDDLLTRFRSLLDSATRSLRAIGEADSARPRAPGKWSRREILGHLVDSASNNHQRFVRAQLGGTLTFPGYAQDGWVATQAYRDEPWGRLVDLWSAYNEHLLHVMSRVPAERRGVSCAIGDDAPVTLEFLMRDYVAHQEHHLAQILC